MILTSALMLAGNLLLTLYTARRAGMNTRLALLAGLLVPLPLLVPAALLAGSAIARAVRGRTGEDGEAATIDRRIASAANRGAVFTVGHSDLSLPEFIAKLRLHGIDTVRDVRSVPFSRNSPHFNRDALAEALAGEGIRYVYDGDAVGGSVPYREQMRSKGFGDTLGEIILDAGNGSRQVLMCTEARPQECHRFSRLGYALSHPEAAGQGFDPVPVQHILRDGRLVPQAELEAALCRRAGLEYTADNLAPLMEREPDRLHAMRTGSGDLMRRCRDAGAACSAGSRSAEPPGPSPDPVLTESRKETRKRPTR